MENKLHILLCEDEESLGMLVREYLQAKGYDAELYLDGEAGYKAFMRTKFDMCLLDVMMPKMDGFTLAREIRMVNAEVPIIFLTAKNLKDDILEGFKLGADDYLTKPFSMDELVYRMEAILRRVKVKSTRAVTQYQLGRFTFDTQRQILSIGDKQTKLTTKECELLSMLCAQMFWSVNWHSRPFGLMTITLMPAVWMFILPSCANILRMILLSRLTMSMVRVTV